MKPDKRLTHMNKMIQFFEELDTKYPKAGYNDLVARLVQERTGYVNKIGRKNGNDKMAA